MNDVIELSRRHWQALVPRVKQWSTAKYLIACIEAAERLSRENNRLEMEIRELRLHTAKDKHE